MAQERAVRTRNAILTAARKAFARSGFDGARIDDIAERAKANKQRIYAYFGSKEQLFAEVQGEAIDALSTFEEELLPELEAEPGRIGTLLLAAYLRFHREHPDFWRLLAWANLTPVAGTASQAKRRAATLTRLRAVFERARATGSVPADAAFDSWFLTLTAVVVFLFANQRTASTNLGLRLDDITVRERLADEALALICARQQPSGT